MHEVLVNRLGGLSLPRKSVVRLTDCPDMTLDVYRGRKTTMQQLSCSTQLNLKFFQLIYVKMPTVVGILTFMSGKNSILSLSEPNKADFFYIFILTSI